MIAKVSSTWKMNEGEREIVREWEGESESGSEREREWELEREI